MTQPKSTMQIRSTQSVDRWVTQFNSVYTAHPLMVIVDMMVTSTLQMILEKHHSHMVVVLDGKQKQNVQLSTSGLTYKTFEGWDWLLSRKSQNHYKRRTQKC